MKAPAAFPGAGAPAQRRSASRPGISAPIASPQKPEEAPAGLSDYDLVFGFARFQLGEQRVVLSGSKSNAWSPTRDVAYGADTFLCYWVTTRLAFIPAL